MRVMVVWCPDWSVVAALEEADRSLRSPAAVMHANLVEVCNGPARDEGVRRGQRRRDAQARCPELLLLAANPDRDARAFEPVLGHHRGAAAGGGGTAARSPRRASSGQLVRHRDQGRRRRLAGPRRERGVGRPRRHRRRPLHRRAGCPHRRRPVVGRGGRGWLGCLPARAPRPRAPGRGSAWPRARQPPAAARAAHARRPRRPARRRGRAPAGHLRRGRAPSGAG